MTRLLLAVALVAASLPAALAGEALVRLIAQKASSLRDLEDLYEARADAGERRTILETAIETSTWLEQVGGMHSARGDALLALARWELLKFDAPPSCGFLADSEGAAQPAVLVRRPGRDELPASLTGFRDRLLFVQLRNETEQPLLLGRPCLELPGGLGRPKTSPVTGTKDWPEKLRALAKWGRWPEQLEGSGQAVLLVWLAADQKRSLSLMVPVRWKEDDRPRHARVAFLKEVDPEGLARARREAIRREARIKRNLEELKRARERPPPEVGAVKKVDPQPEDRMPPVLGRVERAGSGEIIQIRVEAASTYEANRKLRVWSEKKKQWVGVVRINEKRDPRPNQKVFWATIVEGRRNDLIRGTLHE